MRGSGTSDDLWKEAVITQTLLGKNLNEIAKTSGKSVKSISRVLNDPEVRERILETHKRQQDLIVSGSGVDIILAQKDALIHEIVELGLRAVDQNIKLGALKFILERFPEFKKAGDGGTNVQVNFLTSAEAEKVTRAATKLEKMQEVFEQGKNPNVIDCLTSTDAEIVGGSEAA
jgi:hypothetical protein